MYCAIRGQNGKGKDRLVGETQAAPNTRARERFDAPLLCLTPWSLNDSKSINIALIQRFCLKFAFDGVHDPLNEAGLLFLGFPTTLDIVAAIVDIHIRVPIWRWLPLPSAVVVDVIEKASPQRIQGKHFRVSDNDEHGLSTGHGHVEAARVGDEAEGVSNISQDVIHGATNGRDDDNSSFLRVDDGLDKEV